MSVTDPVKLPPPAPVSATIGQSFARIFPQKPPLAIGVAVSGGSDSLALLLALSRWAEARRGAVFAATVDHGLRDGSAAEAEFVAQTCAAIGVAHQILRWDGQSDSNNLQNAARQARYGLLGDWAKDQGLTAVALGHTFDDQAETFLMRLARGSGVDGLACMAEARQAGGITWLRPFLSLRRAGLRAYLTRQGHSWIDDPSNDDPRFDRVKARTILTQLAPLGLDADTLVRTAGHMADARAALTRATQDLAQACAEIRYGDVVLVRDQFDAAPFEIRARLLSHAMGWIASNPYRPRFRALTTVLTHLSEGRSQTLHGCLLSARPDQFRITREFQAVESVVGPAPGLWDSRWQITGPVGDGLHIAPLGETGLRQLGGADLDQHPRQSRISLPAVWQDDALIAAPLPDTPGKWSLNLTDDAKGSFNCLMAD